MTTPRHARAAATAPARTRPIRTVRAVLEREGYEGTWLEMRSNCELRTLDLLGDTDNVPAVREAVAQLIVSHNLVDFAGSPLHIDERCSALTSEELWSVLGAYYTALRAATALPKDAGAS